MKQTITTYQQSAAKVFRLALPIIAGQLGQVMMGFFDTVQIGGLGATYIAASGFANTVYWLTNLLGLGVLFAVSPLVSEAFGEKQEWKAIGVFRSGIQVSLIVSFIFLGLMYVVNAHLSVFRQSGSITTLAYHYLRIVNYSTFFLLLFSAGKQFMDGMGRTTVGMLVTIAGLLLNIVLNHLLIYGHLGMPALGIEGAALATTLSRAFMALAILLIIWRDRQVAALRQQHRQHADARKSYVWPILKIGVPSGFQFFLEVAAFSAGQIMSGWLGEKYLAAHQIAINLASVTFMVLTGIAAAGTILTGYAYGAKDREGIKLAGYTVLAITLLIEIVFAGLFVVGSHDLPRLYTNDQEVITVASTLLMLAAFFQLSDGLQAVAAGALRGLQDVRMPVVIAFVAYWLVMIPTGYLLAFKAGMGVRGLWIGFIIGLSFAAVLLIARFRIKLKTIAFTEL